MARRSSLVLLHLAAAYNVKLLNLQLSSSNNIGRNLTILVVFEKVTPVSRTESPDKLRDIPLRALYSEQLLLPVISISEIEIVGKYSVPIVHGITSKCAFYVWRCNGKIVTTSTENAFVPYA
jgi:hypothetical protein